MCCDSEILSDLWTHGSSERRLVDGVKRILSKLCGGRVMQRGRCLKVRTRIAGCDNGNSLVTMLAKANEWCQKMLDVKVKARVVVGIVLEKLRVVCLEKVVSRR